MHPRTVMFAALCAIPVTPLFAQETSQEPEVEWRDPPIAPVPGPIIRYRPPSKASPPRLAGSWRDYVSPADYPAELWEEGPLGVVRFKMTIDATGKPLACETTRTSGHTALDERTCEIMFKRGRFRPARDREGEFTQGTFEDSYSWRKQPAQYEGSHKVHFAYTVTSEGIIEDCELILAEGAVRQVMLEAISHPSCPRSNLVMNFSPYRDENGEPVERRVVIQTTVQVIETGN